MPYCWWSTMDVLRAPARVQAALDLQEIWSDDNQLQSQSIFYPRISPQQLHHTASRYHSRRNFEKQRTILRCLQSVATADSFSNIPSLCEQKLLLKKKGKEVNKELSGKCIYLIGMMGSGKSTVGKIVAEALGYNFHDSDKLIEEAAGGVSVAEIFSKNNEEGFRDAESQVLEKICTRRGLVVATGGGAVVRPKNWLCMRRGITVWLDVPLDALARRVVAAGTEKRPLLGVAAKEHVFTRALARLSKLYEERGPSYSEADVTLSLQQVAEDMEIDNVDRLTPRIIALKVLEEIQKLFTNFETAIEL